MKEKVIILNNKLKNVHKRFLENERIQAEEYFQRKITPFEFLLMITQDKSFSWLHPFSALIAKIDAFGDEVDLMDEKDFLGIKNQIEVLLKDQASKVANRYNYHLSHDADFIMLHADLKKEMLVNS